MKLKNRFSWSARYVSVLVVAFYSFWASTQQTLAQGAGTFGTIDTPPGVDNYQAASGADIGIIFFISTALRIAAIVAGIWVTFNLFLAGFQYFSKADASSHAKVKDILTMSVIGLLLIVTAYTAAALVGLLIFGDAMYIINPTITGPGTI